MTLTENEKQQLKSNIKKIKDFFAAYQKNLRDPVRISFRGFSGGTIEIIITAGDIYGFTGQTRVLFDECAEKWRGSYILGGGYWLNSYALGLVQQWQEIKADFLREYQKQNDTIKAINEFII